MTPYEGIMPFRDIATGGITIASGKDTLDPDHKHVFVKVLIQTTCPLQTMVRLPERLERDIYDRQTTEADFYVSQESEGTAGVVSIIDAERDIINVCPLLSISFDHLSYRNFLGWTSSCLPNQSAYDL